MFIKRIWGWIVWLWVGVGLLLLIDFLLPVDIFGLYDDYLPASILSGWSIVFVFACFCYEGSGDGDPVE